MLQNLNGCKLWLEGRKIGSNAGKKNRAWRSEIYHWQWAQTLSSSSSDGTEDVGDDGHLSEQTEAYEGGGVDGGDVVVVPFVTDDVSITLPGVFTSSSWTVVEWMPSEWKKFLMFWAINIC